MILYITFNLLLCIFSTIILLLIRNKTTNKNNPVNVFLLKEHIKSVLKKRNFDYKNIKKHPKHIKNQKNNSKSLTYKKIKKTNIYDFFPFIKTKQQTYVEQINKPFYLYIFETAKYIQLKINKNKLKYRSINNECLIETIATSFAHAILKEEKINIFEKFEELSKNIKIYKKEALVLNTLLICKLIEIFVFLHNNIQEIKYKIIQGAKQKKYKHPLKLSVHEIYGIYMFNKSSTKLLRNNKELIVNATTYLLKELDEICYKQKIIYNYIKFLYKDS